MIHRGSLAPIPIALFTLLFVVALPGCIALITQPLFDRLSYWLYISYCIQVS